MSFDIIDLILQAGLIVKLVLVLLAIFSVVSWGIIATKWFELRGAASDSEAFIEVYQRNNFEDAFNDGKHLDRSPMAIVFLTSCNELGRLASLAGVSSLHKLNETQLASLKRIIRWTAQRERTRLERGLSFLATVASASPFIGLFGTVVGIIATFQSIGEAGNASLAVVGPGMAEALVATAVGLLAAIPATMAYNSFITRVDGIFSSLEIFSEEFENDLERLDAHLGAR